MASFTFLLDFRSGVMFSSANYTKYLFKKMLISSIQKHFCSRNKIVWDFLLSPAMSVSIHNMTVNIYAKHNNEQHCTTWYYTVIHGTN